VAGSQQRAISSSSQPPRSQADLAKVRGLSAAWATNAIGDRLLRALEAAEPLPPEEMPAREPQRPGLSSEGALIADLLKLLLKIRSKESGVAPRLVVRGDDLDALAAGVRDGLPVLDGWRREIFGQDALALVEGDLGFVVKDGRLTMTRVAASIE
jgi:ribonuclease D